MKETKSKSTKLHNDLQILFEKMDEFRADIDLTKDISKSLYRSLTDAMVIIETLSRLLVSKEVLSKEEIKEKINELNMEREEISENFKKAVAVQVHADYLKHLLESGSYGRA